MRDIAAKLDRIVHEHAAQAHACQYRPSIMRELLRSAVTEAARAAEECAIRDLVDATRAARDV